MQNSKLEREAKKKKQSDLGTSIEEPKKKIRHSVHKKRICKPSVFGITTWFGIEGWVWGRISVGWRLFRVFAAQESFVSHFREPSLWISLYLNVNKPMREWAFPLFFFFFWAPTACPGDLCLYLHTFKVLCDTNVNNWLLFSRVSRCCGSWCYIVCHTHAHTDTKAIIRLPQLS